ncbi:MAG: transglutaminase domain-containing protein [Chloroflexota bacterium]
MAVTTNGLVASAVHAQSPSVDPSIGVSSAADRFRLPTAADLAADATLVVNDTPDGPTDQDDLTPVIDDAAARVAALAPEDWELAALAATLPDADAAFALVRDSIGFDAYRGLLRGAQGTLSARAGNAFDRAALLKALLDAQGATTRYAFGTLEPDIAKALVARSFEVPVAPLADAGVAFGDAFEATVETRARRDHALLAGALAGHIDGLAADSVEAAVADVTPHAWVQMEQPDGSWLDLDPSMPDIRAGIPIAIATSTGDAIPAAETHAIGIRVLAEHLVGGSLQEAVAMDETLPAAAAGDQRIFLTFTQPGEGGGLLDPGGLLGGSDPTAWAPTLLIDHNAWDGDPILFTGELGGGGLLGPGEQADLVQLALEVTVSSPGAEPQTVRQVLADRLTPSQRASGSFTAEDLAPVADDDGIPAIFRSIVHVLPSTGALSPRAYAQDRGYAAAMTAWGINTPDDEDLTLNEALVPIAVADEAFVAASERRFVPAIDDAHVRAYVATPRVYLVTRSLDLDDVARQRVVTDLAIDDLRMLADDGSDAEATARQLWYGSLQGAFETEYALANASAFESDGLVLEGVSFDMDQSLHVVTSADGGRPDAASGDLDHLLQAGGLAVVPGDVAAARTWWEIAADAGTRSVLAPRLGGGGAGGVGSGRRPVMPVSQPDKPRDQRKQQDDGQNGNEYGTVVENVAGKVEKGARSAGRVVRDGWDVVKKPLIKI